MCDTFSHEDVVSLLEGKLIYYVGDSNMRALYKDTVWLLNNNTLIPQSGLKTKNELSFSGDKRLTDGYLHNGTSYTENRCYRTKRHHLRFFFVTRLCPKKLRGYVESIHNSESKPDVLLINSCLWDLTRWGRESVMEFCTNLMLTMHQLKKALPRTRIIFTTTLPVSSQCRGGFLTNDVQDMAPLMPWHILEANYFQTACAHFFRFDIIDFHHFTRMHIHRRVKDGIHWNPEVVRYLTNTLLTHLALSWQRDLPGREPLVRQKFKTKPKLGKALKERFQAVVENFKLRGNEPNMVERRILAAVRRIKPLKN